MNAQGLHWITVFGLGHRRPAPGTWGSLPPAILAAILLLIGAGPSPTGLGSPAIAWTWSGWLLYHGLLLAVMLAFSLACLLQGDRAEARFNRKDPSPVVADETAGMCLPLMFLPAGNLTSPELILFSVLLAFLAFRAMDILKPWPAAGLQSTPGGWGILLDDLAAGIWALAIVQVCSRVVMPL